MLATMTDVNRATETLRGMVASIAADYKLADEEIISLQKWLDLHCNLLRQPPFDEICQLLNQVLKDGVIEPHEREELLEWCQEFSDPMSHPLQTITMATRRLHGYLAGVVADQEVTDEEIRNLSDWLQEHLELREHWPFYDAWGVVEEVLRDGKITEEERQHLKKFCNEFVEEHAGSDARPPSPDQPHYMKTGAPVLHSLTAVCEKDPHVELKGRRVLFTGEARLGTRAQMQEIAEAAGAIVCGSVVKDLDYLVVGDLSSPQWVYSKYGRKIEKALLNKKQGYNTKIIMEKDFLAALEKAAEAEGV